ncbi:MAG: NAD(+) diphosphatase [Candidatus Bipolaricaulis sp.]|nr:NAD(+) diphosphatase [Candidatus Bipolaricaulis sp.]
MMDRSESLRTDARWIAAAKRDASSRFVVYAGTDVYLRDSLPIGPVGVTARALEELGANLDLALFLGRENGVAWFAIDVAAIAPSERSSIETLGRRVALGAIQDPVGEDAWALLAQARSLLAWNARYRHCPTCGAPMEMRSAGYVRACTNAECGALHFPRSDPAIIVRVTYEDRCLLARQPAYRPGLYSILAGFVEPGESLEDAVRREVAEEVGLCLAHVAYVGSQPWPFPTSLMVGFAAEAACAEIHVDGREIESAEWMTRSVVGTRSENGTLILPSAKSIARRLIDAWLLRAGSATDRHS